MPIDVRSYVVTKFYTALLSEVSYTDEALLKRMAKDDKTAFQLLYERYHHVLYRRVFHLAHSAAETDDILQEVFITLWEKRAQLDTERPIGGWLFTLSFNRLVNHMKKKLREKARVQVLSAISGEPDQADPFDRQWEILGASLHELSPKKRKAFQLCKLEGKTYEKAAVEMGISRHTVKEYLQEAMVSLRDYIRQHPSHDATILFLAFYEIFSK